MKNFITCYTKQFYQEQYFIYGLFPLILHLTNRSTCQLELLTLTHTRTNTYSMSLLCYIMYRCMSYWYSISFRVFLYYFVFFMRKVLSMYSLFVTGCFNSYLITSFIILSFRLHFLRKFYLISLENFVFVRINNSLQTQH